MPATQLSCSLSRTARTAAHQLSLFPTSDPLGRPRTRRADTAQVAPVARQTDAVGDEPEVVFTSDGFSDTDTSPTLFDDSADTPSGSAVMSDARVQLGFDPLTGARHLSIAHSATFRPRHNF